MRVHQRDDQEEGLPPRCDRAQVLQHSLFAIVHIAAVVYDATVVVGVASAELADIPVLTGVGWVPAVKAIGGNVGGRPGLRVVRVCQRLAEVPFPLVGNVVSRGLEDGGHGRQVARKDMLARGESGAEAERIDHAMLRREVAGEEGGATGRAHTAIAEGAVEGESVLAQAGHAR
jgi:hypothetical protein